MKKEKEGESEGELMALSLAFPSGCLVSLGLRG
jgi:hypothetical protein